MPSSAQLLGSGRAAQGADAPQQTGLRIDNGGFSVLAASLPNHAALDDSLAPISFAQPTFTHHSTEYGRSLVPYTAPNRCHSSAALLMKPSYASWSTT